MSLRRYIAVLAFLALSAIAADAQTAAFTYQGRLTDSTLPAGGTYQMQFTLYDASSGGAVVGSTITNTSVSVANGIFTVELDYSPQTPFATGADRWIEIAVKKTIEGSYTTLAPRQKLTSSPYATKSLSADNAANLGGLAANTYLQTTGNGSGLTNLNGANITNNTVSSAALAADTFPNNQNLTRLSSLRWDLLRQRAATGTNPHTAAFDGTHIWVTNNTTNNVSKIRASDGVTVATYGAGSAAQGIVFDGTNMWVANYNGSSVMKFRASDGVLLGTFGVGSFPQAMAFDGANIWVANYTANTVTKLQASDGTNLGSVATGSGPFGVAYDGQHIWVVNTFGNSVAKIRASDSAVIGTYAVGSQPRGIAFDGKYMWVTNHSANTVSKIDASTGAIVATIPTGTNPWGVAFDGKNIWIANHVANTVMAIDPVTGATIETFPVGANPIGVVFDTANIWVVNHLSHTISKLPVFK